MITVQDILEKLPSSDYEIKGGHHGFTKVVQSIYMIYDMDELTNINKPQTLVIADLSCFFSANILNELENLINKSFISSIILNVKDSININNVGLINIANHYEIPLIFYLKEKNLTAIANIFFDFLYESQKRPRKLIENDFVELIHLVTHDKDLKEIINVSADILQNPMIITDESFNLLGYSNLYEVDDPVWEEIIDNGYCPYHIVKILRSEGFLNELNKEGVPVFLANGGFSKFIRRLVSEVTINGEIKGYIALLEYKKPITDLDKQILKYVSSIIALELAKSNAIERAKGHMGEALIKDLVNGYIQSEKSAKNRIQALDWKFFEFLKVILIRHEKGNRISGQHLDTINSIISRDLPGSKVGLTPSEIVVLGTASKESMFNKFTMNMNQYCLSNNLIIGEGRTYTNLLDISKSYKEGNKALDLSNILNESATIYKYENLIVYDLLSNIDRFEYIHPGLLLLKDNDDKEGTDYIKTLDVYFKRRHNISSAASELFLHRNTIAYRIKKIEQITQCSLDDYHICLQLQLSLLLLNMKNGALRTAPCIK